MGFGNKEIRKFMGKHPSRISCPYLFINNELVICGWIVGWGTSHSRRVVLKLAFEETPTSRPEGGLREDSLSFTDRPPDFPSRLCLPILI